MTGESITHIAIVEDNTYLRTAWQTMLDSTPGFRVVGSFGSLEAACSMAEQLAKTDVLLMDIGLPGRNGIEGVREFSTRFPEMAIVMVTVHDDDQHVFDALCAGAVGYLLKKVELQELVEAIRSARQGGAPMTPNVARRVIEAFRQRVPARRSNTAPAGLTPKELEVLQNLARGESYATVAKSMFLSVDGVRYHIRHIYEKLHVHSRSEAVAKGLRESLIRPPW